MFNNQQHSLVILALAQWSSNTIVSLNLNIDPVSGRAFKVIISHQDLEDGKVAAIANETEQETLQGLETDRTCDNLLN